MLRICFKRAALPAFALLGALAASLSAVEIKGRVITPGGRPIASAVVVHRASGASAVSDPAGAFSLSLPGVEKGALAVSHPEHAEAAVRFNASGPDLELSVVLTPLIRQQEEVVVTALRYPEPSFGVPASESVLTSETIAESLPPNIAEGVKGMAGVTNLGTGGFSLVPNIRGLARNRVLILVDGAREICFGLVKDRAERYQGMLDFCRWYSRLGESSPAQGRE